MENKRLDIYIAENNLANSREKAKKLIKSGNVYVNGKEVKKSSYIIKQDDEISCNVIDDFVGVGAKKLEKALEIFQVDLDKHICADIGASTGGFTDIMLRSGASKVYSIDVGHDQLDEKLKNNHKVINMEGLNFRNYDVNEITDKVDFISVDVSFISLKYILPNVSKLLSNEGSCVVLVKPQFEAGKEAAKKGKGIIKSKKVHKNVLRNVISYGQSNNLCVISGTSSPIKGKDGNIEYLLYFKKNEAEFDCFNTDELIEKMISDIDLK